MNGWRFIYCRLGMLFGKPIFYKLCTAMRTIVIIIGGFGLFSPGRRFTQSQYQEEKTKTNQMDTDEELLEAI